MNEFQRIRAMRESAGPTTEPKTWPRKYFAGPKVDESLVGKQVAVKFSKDLILIGTITGLNKGAPRTSFQFSWNKSDNPHCDESHWRPYPELAPSNFIASVIHCGQVICAL